MRQTFKLGIIVLVVASLAMAGIALAQTDEAPQDLPADAPSIAARIAEHLIPLVDAGTITQDQADAVAEHLAEVAPRPDRGRGPGGGPGDGPGRRAGGAMGVAFDVVAETIGIEVDALRDGFASGQTIAEIAATNGSSGQAVIDVLVANAAARMGEAVQSGRLDEADVADHLAAVTDKITTAVNEGFPERPDRGPGRGPGRGGRGPGGGGFGGFPGGPPASDAGTSA